MKDGEVAVSELVWILAAVGLLLVALLIIMLASGKGNVIIDKFDNFWRVFT